ncbi:DUF3667 domain-containing protein [uncultured Aquimarina sp.]|uniref:DUF3667 domain-containing protein n=1 Tax=uncultured Aquimarina sp. TaxID=575652 RepID=UPI002605412D|nr:DUF3667 domain-containing protein [uncultured Aquimarina sp.]
MKSINCLNCKTSYNGNFCPECGQKSTIEKITFSFLVSDFLSRFLDLDKGFLYNLKHLTLSPKNTILNYINGQRKHVFNPISYSFIAITLFLLIQSQFDIINISGSNFIDTEKSTTYKFSYEAGQIIGHYIKYFWLLNILFLSLFTKLFFSKLSFLEHLAMNSFIIGHATIFGIFSFLVLRIPIVFDPLVFIYIIFLLFKVFKEKGERFEKIIASFFTVFFTYLLFYLVPMVYVWIIK